jgi:hypothetical protein
MYNTKPQRRTYVPAKTTKYVASPALSSRYSWYEIGAVVLFFLGFIYVASLQYATIENNISFISCRSAQRSIMTAISEFKADFPSTIIGHVKKDINLKKLVETKYLRYYPKCWCDGNFRLNLKDEVYCTYHSPELEDASN